MLKDQVFRSADIYVPVRRCGALDPAAFKVIAESLLEEGQRTPILLRQDGKCLVLIEGLQSLEACRSLGEETVVGILVRGRAKQARVEPAAVHPVSLRRPDPLSAVIASIRA